MAKFQLKYVFIVQGIIGLFFGLGFLFIPNPILNAMGLDTPPDIGEPIRFYGAMVFGVGVLLILIRNEEHSPMRQAVLLSLVCSFFPQMFLHLFFHPLNNFMVINIIGLDVIFTVSYGYFWLKNRGK